MKASVRCISGLLLLLAGFVSAAPARAEDVPAYKDTSLPFEQRAADLLKRMTLEEKAKQIHVHADANLRLGIPAIDWWTEANHGLSNRGPSGPVTVFPQAIGMAATFDPALIKQIGDATATEARARYMPGGVRYRGLVLWAPTLNMARDPRWGRVEETYGEDPYLTGRMAVAMIQGMQGDDPKYLKTVATPKHFAMHSQETGRFSQCFDCPEPVLRDYYFPAFHDAFVEGKAMGTMVAFSGINKIPDTANFWLLTQVLRREWGFQGFVVSDNGGVSQLVGGQRYVKTEEEAVVTALNAGLDIVASFEPRDFTPIIVQAVHDNSLSERILDRAVMPSLLVRFRLGEFDPPSMVPYARIPASEIGSKGNVAIALKTAQESMVLLKNEAAPRGFGVEKLLPLDLRRINSIALLGPYATSRPTFGAYSGNPANPCPTFLEAMRAAAGDRITFRTASWNDTEYSIKAAQECDVAIVVAGLNMTIEHEGLDRGSILLPGDQEAFIEKIVKANPLTIVVLEGGSPIGMQWVKEHVPAVMMIWYSGEEGAVALAQELLGQVNPSGKLPLTFYTGNQDLPPLDDYDITKGRTYMYFQKPALFEFGYGLSYTTFEYRDVKVTPETKADGKIVVTLNVANTGKMDGEEVVQVYVREKDAAVELKRPLKQLKGFLRVSVPKGEVRPVRIEVPAEKLAFWSMAEKKYVVEAGRYEVMVGSSSEDIRGRGEVILK